MAALLVALAIGNPLAAALAGPEQPARSAFSQADLAGSAISARDALVEPAAPASLDVGAFPGRAIRLRWSAVGATPDSYRIERSADDAAHFAEVAAVGPNVTVYTDTVPLPDTTYWYRVRSVNGGVVSPYSASSYSVSFDSAPSADERYLLVLLNSARQDPAAFGYAALRPVAPLAYNPLLNFAAHAHSQAILNADFAFGHCDPVGRCPTALAYAVGYDGGVAENIIQGQTGPQWAESSNRAFLSSAPHRENMLAADFNEAGIGHTYDPAKGSGYWHGQYTEDFSGRPGVRIPALPSGAVAPYVGNTGTVFTYTVNFYSAEGYTPARAQVVIDGVAYDLSLALGSASNGAYRLATRLAEGVHSYYFSFAYGAGQTARLPESGTYPYPHVDAGEAILQVPAQHATIGAALARSQAGSTVSVAPGIYYEHVTVPAGVRLRGAGADVTIIDGQGRGGSVVSASADTIIEGVTLRNSGADYFDAGVWITEGRVTVRNNRITGNQTGIFHWCFTADCALVSDIQNNVFDNNRRAAIDQNEAPQCRVVNNTVVSNPWGVILNSASSLLQNNIIVFNEHAGVVGGNARPQLAYNDVFGNGANYQNAAPGPGDLSVDPQFEEHAVGAYRLSTRSQARDAGDPAPQFNDADGSRNDMGAFGGPGAETVLSSSARAPQAITTGRVFRVEWSGFASQGIAGYDVQFRVGSGGAWQDWQRRTQATSAEFGPRTPVIVAAGVTYYFRSRVWDRAGRVEDYPAQPDACVTVSDQIIRWFAPVINNR